MVHERSRRLVQSDEAKITMTPNAKSLAMRDPARAAALGILSANGATFGSEFDGEDDGFDMAGEFGDAGADMGGEFDGEFDGEFGVTMGADYGADFGARRRQHAARQRAARGGRAGGPTPAQLAKLVHYWRVGHAHRNAAHARRMLIDPNMGSSIKIQRYTFSVVNATPLAFGTMEDFYLSGQPAAEIRPQRLFVNVPMPFFATYSTIKVANINVNIGNQGDCWEFAGTAVGLRLDMPTLTPANALTVIGNYTGIAPAPYTVPDTFNLIAAVHGPANIAG